MLRFASFIPALLVAVVITVISSLYLNARQELNHLKDSAQLLKNELQNKEDIILRTNKKLADLEQKNLLASIPRREDQRPIDQRGNMNSEFPASASPGHPTEQLTEQSQEAKKPDISQINANTVKAKISSIAKFIPLTDDQLRRLNEKYTAELDPSNTNTEGLEAIIGKENSDFYREQRKNAFEKVLKESIEKEILFVSRKLVLDETQEQLFRQAYLDAENQIRTAREQNAANKSNISTLEKLVLEEKERSRILSENVKNFLNQQQYQEFLKYQTGSQDMQLWHE